MFVDRVTIHVRGGRGGRGCIAFRREKYVPRGGPDGGDGGNGGSVLVRAGTSHTNLAHLTNRKFWHARDGSDGGGANKHGSDGQDVVILVPPGTVVIHRDRGNVLRDLQLPHDEFTVARGGKGGKGNKRFATSTNRAPRHAEPGQDGEAYWVVLELKVIADVGLVGLPNAGKSTLLSRITRAQPEIADYPFTTKYPNLGIVHVDADRSLVVADIPGLIEGAHAGAGLGHDFLRHLERTRVMVHMVEPQPSDGSTPVDNYRTIRRELEMYSTELARRTEIVVMTKLDLTDAQAHVAALSEAIGQPVYPISAVTGRGLADLVRRMFDAVHQPAE